jgi:hypothetical protein
VAPLSGNGKTLKNPDLRANQDSFFLIMTHYFAKPQWLLFVEIVKLLLIPMLLSKPGKLASFFKFIITHYASKPQWLLFVEIVKLFFNSWTKERTQDLFVIYLLSQTILLSHSGSSLWKQ